MMTAAYGTAEEAAEKVAYFRGRFSPWSFFSS
jgi:hypothetical protein